LKQETPKIIVGCSIGFNYLEDRRRKILRQKEELKPKIKHKQCNYFFKFFGGFKNE
jgi:hypothetical protein